MRNETGLFTLTLYVPDATVQALNDDVPLQRLILDGAPELDFISPAWWEGSHTAALGLLRRTGQARAGQEPGPDAERAPTAIPGISSSP